jgi:hypothetical protein
MTVPQRLPERAATRAVRHGLLVAGAIYAAFYLALHVLGTHSDAYDYWSVGFDQLYRAYALYGGVGYAYSPVFALAIAPLRILPWTAFYLLWVGFLAVALGWLIRPLSWAWRVPLILLAVPELLTGNIHLLIAVAIVIGFRHPAAWAFPLLTKVTPGIGLVWFGVRREWRALGVALLATAALVLVSFPLTSDLWPRWLATLYENREAVGPALLGVPLLLRLPVALLVVVVGARSGRRWLVPVAVVIAMPHIYLQSLAVLLAIVRLVTEDQAVPTAAVERAATAAAPSS